MKCIHLPNFACVCVSVSVPLGLVLVDKENCFYKEQMGLFYNFLSSRTSTGIFKKSLLLT